MTGAGLSAPLFHFTGKPPLAADDSHLRPALRDRNFAMSGPSVTAETGHLPVRGDLAHINLAGRYFVPHYAVPMAHVSVSATAHLHRADRTESDVLAVLQAGEVFNVLDIAGGWAWGQIGEQGWVGYIPLDQLCAA